MTRKAAKGTYKSPEGKSPFQLLVDFLDVVENHADEVGLDLDEVPEPVADPTEDASNTAESSEQQPIVPAGTNGTLIRVGAAVPNQPTNADSAPAPEVYDPATDPYNTDKLDVEAIIRKDGLEIYKDQAGVLWTGLATYWTKKAEFEHVCYTSTIHAALITKR